MYSTILFISSIYTHHFCYSDNYPLREVPRHLSFLINFLRIFHYKPRLYISLSYLINFLDILSICAALSFFYLFWRAVKFIHKDISYLFLNSFSFLSPLLNHRLIVKPVQIIEKNFWIFLLLMRTFPFAAFFY